MAYMSCVHGINVHIVSTSIWYPLGSWHSPPSCPVACKQSVRPRNKLAQLSVKWIETGIEPSFPPPPLLICFSSSLLNKKCAICFFFFLNATIFAERADFYDKNRRCSSISLWRSFILHSLLLLPYSIGIPRFFAWPERWLWRIYMLPPPLFDFHRSTP